MSFAMGRPKKTGQEQRVKRLPHVRCTEAEYQSAFDHAKRSGKSLSAYMRELATTGRVVANDHTTDAPLVSFELINQLQKVGVNINQLTRVAHATGGELPKALADAGEDLQAVLDQIITQIEFR